MWYLVCLARPGRLFCLLGHLLLEAVPARGAYGAVAFEGLDGRAAARGRDATGLGASGGHVDGRVRAGGSM